MSQKPSNPTKPSVDNRPYPRLTEEQKERLGNVLQQMLPDLKPAKSPGQSTTQPSSQHSTDREIADRISNQFAENMAAAGKAGKSFN